jgi:hypothetical protein
MLRKPFVTRSVVAFIALDPLVCLTAFQGIDWSFVYFFAKLPRNILFLPRSPMPRRIGCVVWITLLSICAVISVTPLARAATLQQDSETLTNTDVIKMVQAHLGEAVIIRQIQSQTCNFSLNTASLIKLKQAGVSEKIISAMQMQKQNLNAGGVKEQHPERGAQAKSSVAREQSNAEPAYAWTVKNVVDRRTNESHPEAYLIQHTEAGSPERLEVKGTCGSGGMDWLIGYFSGTSTEAKLKLNYPSGGGSRGLALGGIAGVTIGTMINIANAMKPSGPSVTLRVKLDNNSPVIVPSYTQYNNAAFLNFPPSSLTEDSKNSSDNVGYTLNVLDQGFHPRAATLEQIGAASDILVELPREDGSPIYLKIKTHDQGFQKFISGCSSSLKRSPLDQEKIANDMQQARTLLAERPLPWYDLQSAYCLFKDVLKIDPNNREASIGVAGAETRVSDRLTYGMTGIPISSLKCSEQSYVSQKPTAPVGSVSQGSTVAEFENKLTGVLSNASTKYGLGPNGYSRELEYIKRFLETCALADVPSGTQAPSVNDPKFDVCQRQPRKTAFIGNSKDISLAVNNPHNTVFPKAGGRGDVLMLNGQRADTPWQPGEPNTLTVSIFLPPGGAGFLNSSNFDEIISGVQIKGISSPNFSATSNASEDRPGGSSGSNTAVGTGSDVPTDPVTLSDPFGAAMRDYLAKCDAGDAKSCELVGSGLEHGTGVDKNLQSAKAFYNKACSMGRKQSCSRLQ